MEIAGAFNRSDGVMTGPTTRPPVFDGETFANGYINLFRADLQNPAPKVVGFRRVVSAGTLSLNLPDVNTLLLFCLSIAQVLKRSIGHNFEEIVEVS